MTMIFPGQGYAAGGFTPYQSAIGPANLAAFLNIEQADAVRLKRYAEHWRFYHTLHWKFQREDETPLVTMNYARWIVDKAVSWITRNGISFEFPEATKATVKPVIEETWKVNNIKNLFIEMELMGCVTGDIFIMVTYDAPSFMDMVRNPYTQGKIKLDLLGSHQCFPTWDPLDPEKLTSIRIETVYYAKDAIPYGYNGLQGQRQGAGSINVKRFTQIIRPDVIIEQYEGEEPVIRTNILGEIPVVHIKNLPVPRDFWGLSEMDNILPLQMEINEKSTDNSDIIHYHASPLTVVQGAKIGEVNRGANRIWSGLPKPGESNVFNLEMDGDVSSIQNYVDGIREAMLHISETPAVLLDKPDGISNTSGVALQLLFLPIVDKIGRKKPARDIGLTKVNYFILRIAQLAGLVNLRFDLCSKCGGRIVDVFKNNRWTKKCYQIHPDDYSWVKPEEVEVIHIRQHSMGYEVRQSPMQQVQEEHMRVGPSHWDPAAEQDQQVVDDQNKKEDNATLNALKDPVTGSVSLPKKKAKPPKLQGEMKFPDEPERVMLTTAVIDPATGAYSSQETEELWLVPTGCTDPRYLDPYEVCASVQSSLPRDEALELERNIKLQGSGIVSKKWVMRNTPAIDPDEYETIQEELRDEERDLARPEGIQEEDEAEAIIREKALGKQKKPGDPATPKQGPDAQNNKEF